MADLDPTKYGEVVPLAVQRYVAYLRDDGEEVAIVDPTQDGEDELVCVLFADEIAQLTRLVESDDGDGMTDEEWRMTFDPMQDLVGLWGITMEEAEAFLEEVGYFDTERYREVADYFEPTETDT